jgi:flagellar biosynthesis protein FliQ
MKDTYQENYKPTKTNHTLMYVFLAAGAAFLIINVIKYSDKEKVSVTILKTTIQVKRDTLSYVDSIILIKLIPVLVKREGLMLVPYTTKGYRYIGYGHQIVFGDYFPQAITKRQADSILWCDIKAAWIENERIKRITLYQDCFNIFISGKK